MYTFIAQDIHGNWFVSQKCGTKEQIQEEMFMIAEYEWVHFVELLSCEDTVLISSILN